MPTPTELFLQNRLALASSLLFQITRHLSRSPDPKSQTLLIECEHFFSETKRLLAAELSRAPGKGASPIAAEPAEKSGAGSFWAPPTGFSPISSANCTPPPLVSEEVFSDPSSGGIGPMEIPSTNNLPTPPLNSFSMRLKFALVASRDKNAN
jgi:hypothetical protein